MFSKCQTKNLEISESKIHNLKKELRGTNDDLISLQTIKSQIINQKTDAEAKYYELNKDFNNLKDSFNIIKGENSSLENILIEVKERYTSIIKDNKTLELDCQALLNDNRSARLKIEELLIKNWKNLGRN